MRMQSSDQDRWGDEQAGDAQDRRSWISYEFASSAYATQAIQLIVRDPRDENLSSGTAEFSCRCLGFSRQCLRYLTCDVVIETRGGSGLSAVVLPSLDWNGTPSG